MSIRHVLLLSLFGLPLLSSADEIRVAVASNFLEPIQVIADAFEQQSNTRVLVSAGSTGKLYAQIVNGAPFDLFLAANSREPRRLEEEAGIKSASRYTYALGALALWVPKAGVTDAEDARAAFMAADCQRLAIANPRTAPYGAAAMAVLESWDQADSPRRKLLRGENISQAYQFVASGNADCGFVAVSQLLNPKLPPAGRYWPIDQKLYPPIRQQLVLLSRAANKPAAVEFWRYLKAPGVREQIKAFGYGLEQP